MQHEADPSNVSNPPLEPFADLIQAIRHVLQPPVTTSSPSASASPMARPVTYPGEAGECSRECYNALFFEMQFHNDAYIILLMCTAAGTVHVGH